MAMSLWPCLMLLELVMNPMADGVGVVGGWTVPFFVTRRRLFAGAGVSGSGGGITSDFASVMPFCTCAVSAAAVVFLLRAGILSGVPGALDDAICRDDRLRLILARLEVSAMDSHRISGLPRNNAVAVSTILAGTSAYRRSRSRGVNVARSNIATCVNIQSSRL